jgi:heme oxygenase
MPMLEGEAEFLGATYVMEGSRLGGQLIARHVEGQLALEPGQGDAYFLGFGEETGAKWKELIGMLEARVPEGEEERAIGAAKAMFALFGNWMRGGAEQSSAGEIGSKEGTAGWN